VRELSRVEADPQSTDFPEARQLLRSQNQTTAKKESAAQPENTENKAQKQPFEKEAAQADPARQESQRADKDKTQPEDLTRYFISSLNSKKTSGATMAQKIQSHWCCESRHWQRDALWREDACLLRNPNTACALALLRTALQTLLRSAGRTSLPVVFEDVAHDLSLGLGWLKSHRL
jgi:predicted transposase YbfD/YdcC